MLIVDVAPVAYDDEWHVCDFLLHQGRIVAHGFGSYEEALRWIEDHRPTLVEWNVRLGRFKTDEKGRIVAESEAA
jgi:hypothetical protein